MENHIDKVLLTPEQIDQRLTELAELIAGEFQPDTHITIIPILTGSLIFVADLIRKLPLMMHIDMVTVSSYRGTSTTAQTLKWKSPVPENLNGKQILLIDDILDSGQTIASVRQAIEEQSPALLKTCVFVRKKRESAMTTPVDYVGFDIEDEFVVGYGLDYDGYYRNLPQLATLKPDVIAPTDE